MGTSQSEVFSCAVCFEPFVDPCTVVPCGHSACCHCLTAWLDRGNNTRCPSCAAPITHACLSFALRTAVEAAHGPAVAARRAALNIQQPATFYRAITRPNFVGQLRNEAMDGGGGLWLGVVLTAVIGFFGFGFVLLGIGALTKVTIVASVGLAALVHHLNVHEAFIEIRQVAAGVVAGEEPRPLARAMFRAVFGGGEPNRGRRLFYAFGAAWLLLFCVFFVLLHSQIQLAQPEPTNSSSGGGGGSANESGGTSVEEVFFREFAAYSEQIRGVVERCRI